MLNWVVDFLCKFLMFFCVSCSLYLYKVVCFRVNFFFFISCIVLIFILVYIRLIFRGKRGFLYYNGLIDVYVIVCILFCYILFWMWFMIFLYSGVFLYKFNS